MKIAVPYENGEICSHLAQVKEFLIFDVVDDEIISTKTVKQTYANDPGALVEFLKKENTAVLLCDALPIPMMIALRETSIQVLGGAKGAPKDRVEDFLNGMVMVQNTKATVKTYALQSFADFRCRIVETLLDGMLLNLDGSEVWVKFLGRFNAYNLTSVYATALLLDARRDEVLRILSDLTSVDGRFEPIHSKEGVTAIVDYAHTPDALQNVIGTINEIRKKDQRLYVVVGCGGNRDATKRPEMAKIAVDGSDMAVLTSDNPRLEEPGAIIEQMKSGLEPSARYLAITDRREAIKAAVALARPGDIILVAGKGHETYQDVGGVKHHFDDREEVRAAFGTVL